MNPPPQQMLFEACVDTVQSLRLMRLGSAANVPFIEALTLIDTAIDQLEYAISATLDAKEPA